MSDVAGALVSIVIPTYNGARYLSEAIDSALGQTYPHIEVVVVDDGSTDETAEIVTAYGDRVLYLRQDNAGPSVARNRGIFASRGDFLCFLDSDDKLRPEMVSELVACADDDTVGVVYCGHYLTSPDGEVVGQSVLDGPSGYVFEELFKRGGLCVMHAAIVRRAAVIRAGLFDTRLRQWEDYEFWIRVAKCCKFKFVPAHLVEYRQLMGSNGRDPVHRVRSARVLRSLLRAWVASGDVPKQVERQAEVRLGRARLQQIAQDAFLCYWAGDRSAAGRLALRAIAGGPRYMFNRGLWAIAAKCVVAKRPRASEQSVDECGDPPR